MLSTRLNIKQWAEDDRPRERLERLGPAALTNAELLAILIGSGSARESAVDLMRRVLDDCHDNLNTLGKLSIEDLCRYNGVGPAKAITILAACELGKRRQMESAEERPVVATATQVYNHMHPVMQDLDVEEFWVLLLNQKLQLIKKMRVSHGGISEVLVDVRVIMREAVMARATVLVACHNHPGGSAKPSKQDDALTKRLGGACELMRIRLLDHVVVTDGEYYSYHESGKL